MAYFPSSGTKVMRGSSMPQSSSGKLARVGRSVGSLVDHPAVHAVGRARGAQVRKAAPVLDAAQQQGRPVGEQRRAGVEHPVHRVRPVGRGQDRVVRVPLKERRVAGCGRHHPVGLPDSRCVARAGSARAHLDQREQERRASIPRPGSRSGGRRAGRRGSRRSSDRRAAAAGGSARGTSRTRAGRAPPSACRRSPGPPRGRRRPWRTPRPAAGRTPPCVPVRGVEAVRADRREIAVLGALHPTPATPATARPTPHRRVAPSRARHDQRLRQRALQYVTRSSNQGQSSLLACRKSVEQALRERRAHRLHAAVARERAQVLVDAEQRERPGARARDLGDRGQRRVEELPGEALPPRIGGAADHGSERPERAAVAVLRAGTPRATPRSYDMKLRKRPRCELNAYARTRGSATPARGRLAVLGPASSTSAMTSSARALSSRQ